MGRPVARISVRTPERSAGTRPGCVDGGECRRRPSRRAWPRNTPDRPARARTRHHTAHQPRPAHGQPTRVRTSDLDAESPLRRRASVAWLAARQPRATGEGVAGPGALDKSRRDVAALAQSKRTGWDESAVVAECDVADVRTVIGDIPHCDAAHDASVGSGPPRGPPTWAGSASKRSLLLTVRMGRRPREGPVGRTLSDTLLRRLISGPTRRSVTMEPASVTALGSANSSRQH